MAAQEQVKWEGKATAKLDGIRAEQVWPLLEDFCSVDKWLPTIDTCYQVEGINGQPGLVRYCASRPPSSTFSPSDDSDDDADADDEDQNSGMTKWCHEKLLAIDPVVRCLSYEVLDNNLGFKSYVATIKLLPAKGDNDLDKCGCQIEWSFLADPVEGLTCDVLSSYLNLSLQGMAENMERALHSN